MNDQFFPTDDIVVETPVLESPIAPPLSFPANGFMQIPNFAVDLQIDNLIDTYGPDMIKDIVLRKVG